MSSGYEPKPPPPLEKTLSYISFALKDLVGELKKLNENLGGAPSSRITRAPAASPDKQMEF